MCENNWVRKNSKSNEGRQAKNGGVKGRDGRAEELNRETAYGEEQITVDWTSRKDGGWQIPKRAAELRAWAGHDETREAKAEMGGLC